MPELSNLHEQIQLVARHEQDFLHRRTRSERVGDALGGSIGSLWFAVTHVCWIGAWIALNLMHGTYHFDPSPFPLLDSIVAIEAIFLASFILMRQGRLSRRADERDHLILQILILTEREMTAVLGIQRQLATRMGLQTVAADEDLEQMSQETSIDEITQKLQEHLPES
jgi:uncharacterized membrane protein